jgi:hypothetical protein
MRIWVGGANAPADCVHVPDADEAIDYIITEERFCESTGVENDIKSISVFVGSEIDVALLSAWLSATGKRRKYILTFRNYESESIEL